MAEIRKLTQKGLLFLRTRGVRETARRAVLRLERKSAEKRYVRRMNPSPEELAAQRERSESWGIRFSVVVPLYNTPPDLLREMIRSVRQQSYAAWELCLADGSDEAHAQVEVFCREQAEQDPRIRYRKLEKNAGISGNTNAALEMTAGDYIALFDHDDLLRADALYEMARAIREKGADFLYSDEMIFVSPRVTNIVGIRFKPDFAPEDLLTNNYICHLTVFRRDLLKKTEAFRPEFDGSQDHDLVLRLTAVAERIVHVPRVLYCWRSVPGSTASDVYTKEYAIDAGRRAVAAFLHAHGRLEARVESTDVFPTMYRIREPVIGVPSVRVLFRASGSAGDAEKKMQQLQAQTAWKNCVWTVIPGNGTAGQEALRAAEATEDFLLFLQDIYEAPEPDWMQEMLVLAQQDPVGAVGAKVRFAGGLDLRHTGIILGLGQGGVAGRPYFDRYDDQVGFFGQLAIVRDISAVTDAWMVRRDKFEAAGGFDPAYAEVLFDIDFCLKLREKGYRNLWTPYALLLGGKAGDYRLEVGRESAAWGRDSALFREKWKEALERGDPYYNPNLSLKHEDWRLADRVL